MTVAPAFALLTALFLAALLVAERLGEARLKAVAKPLASASFLACALAAGAWQSPYGTWVLVGLTLSSIGDVCLLSREKRPFKAGLIAFLLAHVAYGGAFLASGVAPRSAALATVVVLAPALVTTRWLLPHVDGPMKRPVATYIVVISGMLVLGAGAFASSGRPVLLVAPLLFYLSDLAVARDRFVEAGSVNRLVGLPLYYAAQVLFALSTGGA
jgi:uncharacterized membrane protein YhhN